MPGDLPREHDIVYIEIYTSARVVNGFSSVLRKEGQEPETCKQQIDVPLDQGNDWEFFLIIRRRRKPAVWMLFIQVVTFSKK